jgi:uncharacterized membrane protein
MGGIIQAFLYSGGVMQDLGTLGGDASTSAALGINNVGSGVSNTTFDVLIRVSGEEPPCKFMCLSTVVTRIIVC